MIIRKSCQQNWTCQRFSIARSIRNTSVYAWLCFSNEHLQPEIWPFLGLLQIPRGIFTRQIHEPMKKLFGTVSITSNRSHTGTRPQTHSSNPIRSPSSYLQQDLRDSRSSSSKPVAGVEQNANQVRVATSTGQSSNLRRPQTSTNLDSRLLRAITS